MNAVINYLSMLSKVRLITLVALSLVAVAGPLFWGLISSAQNPWIFKDDSRILFPYFAYSDPGLFQNDLMANVFWSQFYQPIGFFAANYLWAHLGDPYVLIKHSPLLLWPLSMIAIGVTAWRLGGALNCWLTGLIAINYPFFFGNIAGGLPHSYSIPFLCLCLMALVCGRFFWLAFFIILSSCFYPTITVIMGMAMAIVLLVGDTQNHGDLKDKSTLFKWCFVGLTGVTSVLIILFGYTLMSPADFGVAIDQANIAQFPEFGPGGRIGQYATYSWLVFIRMMVNQFHPFIGVSASLLVLFSTLILFKWGVKKFVDTPHYHFRAVVFANLFIVVLCWMFLPSVYVFMAIKITFPLFFVFLLPLSFKAYLSSGKGFPDNTNKVLLVALCLITIVMLKPNSDGKTGYSIQITQKDIPVYEFISTLPKDALFAGLPGHLTVLENVPFVSKRRAFVLFELHSVPYVEATLDLRERVYTAVDAYRASDLAPFIKLHDKWHADYFIFQKSLLHKESYGYTQPFKDYYEEKFKATAEDELIIEKIAQQYSIYNNADVYIIDLNALVADVDNGEEPHNTDSVL